VVCLHFWINWSGLQIADHYLTQLGLLDIMMDES
jgi:hypothetical protein